MSGTTPTITLTSDGKKLEEKKKRILSVDVRKTVNRIPSARIVISEGADAVDRFAASDDTFFKPGKEVEIKARHEGASGGAGSDKSIFKGLVIKHRIVGRGGAFFLQVDLKDKAFKMSTLRKNKVYEKNKKDKDIVSAAIKDSGLQVDSVKSMDLKHTGEMVQYYCSNWDFTLSRAEANGCWVIAESGKITIDSPKTLKSKGAKHTFTNMDMIYEFEMEADIGEQLKTVKSTYWDVKKLKLAEPKKATSVDFNPGDLKAADGAKKVGGTEAELIHAVNASGEEMKAWADARMIKTRMSMAKGRLRIPGDGSIKLGEVLKVSKIGKRFNGKSVISGIRHRIDSQGWKTDIQFGLPAEPFSESTGNIMTPPAAGLIPGVRGLQIGVVDDFEKDPDKLYRVRVKIPAVDETTKGLVWARLASVDSGKARGVFFRPEKGDEVVLGFLGDDPRQPVILGALHSAKNAPPVPEDDIKKENWKKGIFTKEKLKIEFDEEKKEMTLATPEKNFITLTEDTEGEKAGIIWTDQHNNIIKTNSKGIYVEDEKGDKITLEKDASVTFEDSKGNKIVLEYDDGITITDKDGSSVKANSDGLTLDSSKDLILKASGDITMEGTAITVKGSGDVKVEGSAVDMN